MRNDSCVRWAMVVVMSVLASGGCGYTVRPPFNPTIKTVYVSMVKSQRFRRDLNIQLTELVKNEIQNRTPYRVVGRPEGADATLSGVITFDDKNIMVESPNNLPRQLMATLICAVSFTDNRTNQTSTTTTKAPVLPALVAENIPFYPEIGETASLGLQKTLQEMARDIVNMMEEPWGSEYRPDPDRPPTPEYQPEKPSTGRPRTY